MGDKKEHISSLSPNSIYFKGNDIKDELYIIFKNDKDEFLYGKRYIWHKESYIYISNNHKIMISNSGKMYYF